MRYLHFATHGFFADDDARSKFADAMAAELDTRVKELAKSGGPSVWPGDWIRSPTHTAGSLGVALHTIAFRPPANVNAPG